MTLQRFWTGSIDGTTFEEAAGLPCRCLVSNPEAFVSPYSGATTFGAEGTPHTQYLYLPEVGIFFGVTIEFAPQALLTTVLDKLKAAIAANASVRVVFTDGFQTIDVAARPSLPDWYVRGEISGAYVQNVTFNFISTGD